MKQTKLNFTASDAGPPAVCHQKPTFQQSSLACLRINGSQEQEIALGKHSYSTTIDTLLPIPSSNFISVLVPCLNEAETISACVEEIRLRLAENVFAGEVLIADNSISDGSQAIALSARATVYDVLCRGYGNAVRGGVAACSGNFIIMGDADGSYDFGDIPKFVAELEKGADLVMGNRFAGGIMPGAMPWLHRYLGNPVLSWIGRLFFGCKVRDFHCGLRGFTRDAFNRMNLKSTGMEFASEMVIKATLKGMKIVEVPTTLRPDGRSRPPHLRTWRDGWRHLRFMLSLCPRWLFLIPGTTLAIVGMIAVVSMSLFGRLLLGSVALSVNTAIVAAMMVILGTQLILLGVFARRFAVAMDIYQPHPWMTWLVERIRLEHGIASGLASTAMGLGLLVAATWHWRATGFGELSSNVTLQRVIPAATLMMVGMQAIFGSFFLGILQFAEKRDPS